MPRSSNTPNLPGALLAQAGLLLAAMSLAACADAGPGPATPTPEGPTGKAAAPFPIATESPTGTAAPTATATATPTAAPTSSGATTSAAGAPTSAIPEPPTEMELIVRLSDGKKEGGKLAFDVDSDRMTATHRVYEVDAADLEKAIGKKKGVKIVSMKLSCVPGATRTEAGDPNGARPMGGFTFHTQNCKLLKLISTE